MAMYCQVLVELEGHGREEIFDDVDLSRTVEQWALGFEFDIVLRGRDASVFDDEEEDDE